MTTPLLPLNSLCVLRKKQKNNLFIVLLLLLLCVMLLLHCNSQLGINKVHLSIYLSKCANTGGPGYYTTLLLVAGGFYKLIVKHLLLLAFVFDNNSNR